VLEPGQVAACGDVGHGHGELDATHRLEGRDDGSETPARDLRSECSLKALASCVVFSHGPARLLADDLLGGRRTDHCRQPAQIGGSPGGAARIADILAQEEGLQPVLGGLAIPDRLVLDRWDIDRGQIAGPHLSGELGRVDRC
jgi:hypothetical protein